MADFRNLQDRTKRDISSARDFAISRFATDLLDSVDNLDRALAIVPVPAPGQGETQSLTPSPETERDRDIANLHEGLKMTERVLMQTLAKHGLERFDPAEKGDRFDPNLHEASFMAKMDGKEDGTVFSTVQKGFRLNGRVIRVSSSLLPSCIRPIVNARSKAWY